MTEDTNWLKKNPMMSLWRSSRFFGKDMDASLMANEQKSKNDVLAVSHVPRRSNIPMDKIKQMDFKFPAPAPVLKKTGIKKPVTRMSKFAVPQIVVTRPSIRTNSGESKTGIQKPGFIKPNGRPSVFVKPSPAGTSSNNSLISNTKTAQRTPVTEKFNQQTLKSSADLSLLSQSKVVSQSTPNETAVLRSILKQKGSSERSCSSNLPGKKSTAAKRVNFNGSFKNMSQGNKYSESDAGAWEPLPGIQTEEGTTALSSPKLELEPEPDEETTVAFKTSFKRISYEEEEVAENKENDENGMDSAETSDSEEIELDVGGNHSKNVKSDFSVKFMSNLMDLWKIYHSKVNHIRNELMVIDNNFQRIMQLVMNGEMEEKLSAYEQEKRELYERLKTLEVEFRGKVRNQTDIKAQFLIYAQEKKNIFGLQSELEENFGKALSAITEKYAGEAGVEQTEDESESAEVPPEDVPHTKKTVKRISRSVRKSGCNSAVKKRSTPRKRRSREMRVSDDGGTPDNTPARRKKLSRRIEKQIRNLFED